MILKHDSVIRFLPINLEKRQFIILDSIRFSLEIIDNSWLSLISQIQDLSSQNEVTIKDFPRLYIEAWSIIDNVQRLIKLHSLLKIRSQNDFMDEVKFVKDFRHTFQHLDERIDEALIEYDIPIFGLLSWNYLNQSSGNIDIFITSSGVARYDLKFQFDASKFDRTKSIDNIIFETIVRRQGKFERGQLELNVLILKLEKIVSLIEKDLESKFHDLGLFLADWKLRKDILIKLKNE